MSSLQREFPHGFCKERKVILTHHSDIGKKLALLMCNLQLPDDNQGTTYFSHLELMFSMCNTVTIYLLFYYSENTITSFPSLLLPSPTFPISSSLNASQIHGLVSYSFYCTHFNLFLFRAEDQTQSLALSGKVFYHYARTQTPHPHFYISVALHVQIE